MMRAVTPSTNRINTTLEFNCNRYLPECNDANKLTSPSSVNENEWVLLLLLISFIIIPTSDLLPVGYSIHLQSFSPLSHNNTIHCDFKEHSSFVLWTLPVEVCWLYLFEFADHPYDLSLDFTKEYINYRDSR